MLVDNSEVLDNRHFTTTNITPEILSEQYDFNNIQQDSQQDIFYSDDNIEQFQNQEEQFPAIQNTQQDTNLPQHLPDPSETATIQNVSEISDITTNNPQSIAITNDSNIVQIAIHNITQNTLPNQNHFNTDSNQDGSSTISTSGTNITPQLQTQQPSLRNYDPPSIPPQYSTQTLSHTSPHTSHTNVPQRPLTVQFKNSIQQVQPEHYIYQSYHTQNTQTQNTQPTLTINILQPYPISNYTTSRNITRPPLQSIPTNPISYNLTSTNPNTTQHSTINNHQLSTLNPPCKSQTLSTTRNTLQPTQFQSSHSHFTTIRNNPHFHNTYTQPSPKTQNITSNASHTPSYNTIPA